MSAWWWPCLWKPFGWRKMPSLLQALPGILGRPQHSVTEIQRACIEQDSVLSALGLCLDKLSGQMAHGPSASPGHWQHSARRTL